MCEIRGHKNPGNERPGNTGPPPFTMWGPPSQSEARMWTVLANEKLAIWACISPIRGSCWGCLSQWEGLIMSPGADLYSFVKCKSFNLAPGRWIMNSEVRGYSTRLCYLWEGPNIDFEWSREEFVCGWRQRVGDWAWALRSARLVGETAACTWPITVSFHLSVEWGRS